MSRSRTRARNRRAHSERLVAEFQMKRAYPEAFADLLHRIVESDVCLWAIARSATRENPLDDEETALIAQAVAPRLAGMTPGSVLRRHKMGQLED